MANMANIEFIYNGKKTVIQSSPDEKMKVIVERFINKINKKSDELYFLYDGKILVQDLTFNETANLIDKKRNQISLIAFENNGKIGNVSTLKKSKNIICPKCSENIFISIKDYKIKLYECKNGHNIDNILFNEFKKTQYIDESKIECENCKKSNKAETFNNQFFICYSCKINLCPLCKNEHDKSHYIFNYNEKDFICRKHYDTFNSYCIECKKDICVLCEKEHTYHDLITYGSIVPNIDEYNKQIETLEKKINSFKEKIKEIISNLNNLVNNLESYLKICNDVIINFDIRKRNYSILQNIKNIENYTVDFSEKINKIINENDIKKNFNDIVEIIDKMLTKEKEKPDNILEKLFENMKEYNNIKEKEFIDIKKIISYEEIIQYADKIQTSNALGMKQEKTIIITDKAIYNLKKLIIERRIDFRDIIGITISKLSDELIIHLKYIEDDFLFLSKNMKTMIIFIAKNYQLINGEELKLFIINIKSIFTFATLKEEKQKNYNVSRMPCKLNVKIDEYLLENN